MIITIEPILDTYTFKHVKKHLVIYLNNSFVSPALLLVQIVLIVGGCTRKESSNVLKIEQDKAKVSIINNSNEDVEFTLIVDNQFPLTKERIVYNIEKLADSTNLPLPIAAWLHVCNITEHADPITLENWIHDPLIYLNSIGVGYCDDHASILALTWQWLGYESRVWTLSGHVVPEVYFDSAWHMMDPAYDIFYLDKDLNIASVETLICMPQLITNPIQTPQIIAQINKNLKKHAEEYLIKNSEYLANLYGSHLDNDVSNWSIENFEEQLDLNFMLPSKAKITFPITFNNAQSPKLKGNGLKATLYKTTDIQSIKIPLIFVEVRGNEQIITNNKVSTYNTQMMDLDQNLFNKEVAISMTTDSVELFYALNPNIFNEKTNFNNIIISGELPEFSEKKISIHIR